MDSGVKRSAVKYGVKQVVATTVEAMKAIVAADPVTIDLLTSTAGGDVLKLTASVSDMVCQELRVQSSNTTAPELTTETPHNAETPNTDQPVLESLSAQLLKNITSLLDIGDLGRLEETSKTMQKAVKREYRDRKHLDMTTLRAFSKQGQMYWNYLTAVHDDDFAQSPYEVKYFMMVKQLLKKLPNLEELIVPGHIESLFGGHLDGKVMVEPGKLLAAVAPRLTSLKKKYIHWVEWPGDKKCLARWDDVNLMNTYALALGVKCRLKEVIITDNSVEPLKFCPLAEVLVISSSFNSWGAGVVARLMKAIQESAKLTKVIIWHDAKQVTEKVKHLIEEIASVDRITSIIVRRIGYAPYPYGDFLRLSTKVRISQHMTTRPPCLLTPDMKPWEKRIDLFNWHELRNFPDPDCIGLERLFQVKPGAVKCDEAPKLLRYYSTTAAFSSDVSKLKIEYPML